MEPVLIVSPAPRRRRGWRWVVLGLFLTVALFLVAASVVPEVGLRRYRAQLITQGEQFSIRALAPTGSADAERAGRDFSRLGNTLPQKGRVMPNNQPSAMEMVGPGKARIGWQRPEVSRADRGTNQWEELRDDLVASRGTLSELRTLARGPEFFNNLNYQEGFSLLLPHLGSQKRAVQWLGAETLWQLHEGRTAEAGHGLVSMVGLTRQTSGEPLLISQLVHIALGAIAFNHTWEAWQADGWSDAELAEMAECWQETEFRNGMIRALEMERAMVMKMFRDFRASPAKFGDLLSQYGAMGLAATPPALPALSGVTDLPDFVLAWVNRIASNSGLAAQGWLWRWWGAAADERFYLERMQQFLEQARRRSPAGPSVSAEEEVFGPLAPAREALEIGLRRRLSSLVLPSLGRSMQKAQLAEAYRNLAVAALALRRYQLRHGQWPESLDKLVPEFLQAVPGDPFDGERLRYRRTPPGDFALYSVNADGRDDGGDPEPPEAAKKSRSIALGRDLVWPWPATAEEVAAAESRPRGKGR